MSQMVKAKKIRSHKGFAKMSKLPTPEGIKNPEGLELKPREIAEEYGFSQVIILMRKSNGDGWIYGYGESKEEAELVKLKLALLTSVENGKSTIIPVMRPLIREELTEEQAATLPPVKES